MIIKHGWFWRDVRMLLDLGSLTLFAGWTLIGAPLLLWDIVRQFADRSASGARETGIGAIIGILNECTAAIHRLKAWMFILCITLLALFLLIAIPVWIWPAGSTFFWGLALFAILGQWIAKRFGIHRKLHRALLWTFPPVSSTVLFLYQERAWLDQPPARPDAPITPD